MGNQSDSIESDTLNRTLNIGFVGGGMNSAVGYTHYLASRLDGRFNVSAGCFSRNNILNDQTATKFGVPQSRCYQTLETLLTAEADLLDAVCVLTPTPNHAQTVVKALSEGYDVICEKAMATSTSEARLIREALSRSGRKMMVIFNYVGYPMVREARAIIDSGSLGDIQQIFCEMPQEGFAKEGASPQAWRRQDYEIPCVSLDLGVHVHQLIHFLTGWRICLSLMAKEANFGKVPGVIDTVNLIGEYQGGILANLMWSKAALGHSNGLRFRIFAERGSLEWCQSNPEILMLCDSEGIRRSLERGQPRLLEANKPRYNRFKAGHPAGFVEAFANIYYEFYEILIGQQTDLCESFSVETAEDGLAFLTLVHEKSNLSIK